MAVKRLLSSYRWRRRLIWLTALAVIVGAGTAIALLVPNTRPKEIGPSNVTVKIAPSPTRVRLTQHDEALALAVASRFLHTAVARRDVDRSWNLVSVEFRSGFTRKQWDSGDLPVVTYPVGKTRSNLLYSDTDGVGYLLAISPTRGSHQAPASFEIGLHPVGSGQHRRWVVDSWQPVNGGVATASGGGGGGGGGNASGSGTSPEAEGKPAEGKIWLLVPAGLLSLIVLIPLGIVSVTWIRARRARRALL